MLFLNVCASVAESEYEKRFCLDLVGDFMKHLGGLLDIANRIELLMRGFELKGRCLIKKGVSVEDPSVCEGSLDDGLVIVGSRMQVFIDRELRSAVYRVGGACTVTIGDVLDFINVGAEVLSRRKPGIVLSHEKTACVAVGPCSFSDLPKLAEKAAALAEGRYSEIYERCHQRWKDARSEEVVSLVEELTHKRHLDLLEELEEGERR
jgi:3-deoxy-D-arabino-heptulosonate 7-phosphate (DAHP) synthase